jgi:SAM-dependent MidA family methyltransferase
MDLALYYPNMGYYQTDSVKMGCSGDYVTVPELICLFGKLLGRQIEEMWELMNRPALTIIEYGAGSGKLCADILAYLEKNKSLFEQLNYIIIEQNEYLVLREKKLLHTTNKVSWYKSIDDISFEYACVIANEVLDNFPVHRIKREKNWLEIFVDHVNGNFTEVERPCNPSLIEHLLHIPALPSSFETEINCRAKEWIREVARKMDKGFSIIIDYGYIFAELTHAAYQNGTVLSFSCQRVSKKFYEQPGKQDITAQVNFSILKQWALQSGMQSCGLTLQSHFLHCLGLVQELRHYKDNFYPLVINLSRQFKVLILKKGLSHCSLTGMQFASDYF